MRFLFISEDCVLRYLSGHMHSVQENTAVILKRSSAIKKLQMVCEYRSTSRVCRESLQPHTVLMVDSIALVIG